MSVVPENISLSIQRSVKIAKYQYNKIELGMVIEIQDEQPKDIIKRLYAYLDVQVDLLLRDELAKVSLNKQAIADVMEEDDEIPF